jgi:hypothetical protein
MIEAISADQAAAFFILRRARRETDELSERSHSFDGGRMGQLGLNPSLARRGSTEIGDVWVVPGNGWLALMAGGTTATPTDVIKRQGTMTWTSSQGGNGLVHGLVPDGVAEVVLRDSLGASATVQVNDNVYGTMLNGYFRSLSFTGPAGPVELGPYE